MPLVIGVSILIAMVQLASEVSALRTDQAIFQSLAAENSLLLARLQHAETKSAQVGTDLMAAQREQRILQSAFTSLQAEWVRRLSTDAVSPVLTAPDGRRYTLHGWPRLSLLHDNETTLVQIDETSR